MKKILNIDDNFKTYLKENDTAKSNKANSHDIAIIGISLRMPKANSIDKFWDIIKNGIECTIEFPEQRKKDIDEYLNYINSQIEEHKFFKASYLDEIDKFDYSFFNISPKEAELMNPIHRMYLENVYNAIEDSGYSCEELNGSKTGIYLGFISDLEGYQYKEMINKVDKNSLPISTAGNLSSMIASRISYLLNLNGPSMLIDTACSSSLVAVHLACQAIRRSDCNMAIVGASKINFVPLDDDDYKIGIESSDGMTRTFDDKADGSGYGEGIISVVLKRFDKAQNDRDNIYAVIKGSAVNQDGSSASITAPNALSQADVITSAWKDAGVDPNDISYIEAHGTATKIGDSIEVEGLNNAFKRYTDRKQFCAIGSIKSNIGHLFDCAGLAGLTKSILALQHKMLPPTVNYDVPKRDINFENMPFYVNNKLRYWYSESNRICGVSSFGISGTNCHVVLQEYSNEDINISKIQEERYLLTISAKDKTSLDMLIKEYRGFLEDTNLDIGDICFTANRGRSDYNHRVAIIGKDAKEMMEKIDYLLSGNDNPDVKHAGYKIIKDNVESKDDNEIFESEMNNLTELLKSKVNQYAKDRRSDYLRQICDLYVHGGNINWTTFYKGLKYRRVSIPCYQFNNKRAWIKVPKMKDQSNDNNGNLYYEICWSMENLDKKHKNNEEGIILLFKDNKGVWNGLRDKFNEYGCRIITVGFGDEFKKSDNFNYVISDSEDDYKKLFNEIKAEEVKKIVHLTTLGEYKINNIQKLKEYQDKGVYSAFNIVKGINSQNELAGNTIDLVIVSRYISEVSQKEEILCPENAPLMGIGKVINKEFTNIKCRCVDIDDDLDTDSLFKEIISEVNEYHVAYRNNCRYIEVFNEKDIENDVDDDFEIMDNGVYIITGGLGAIGVNMAKYLINKNENANIILVGRSEMADVNGIIEDDIKVRKKVDRVKEIHILSDRIKYKSVDICDENGMKVLLDDLRAEYGKINGIIHAAGIPGSGFIINKNKSEFDKVLEAKVYGTWNIDNLTKNDNLDFMLLFSSGVSFIGEAGLSDYTAANLYLDSYSFYRNKEGRKTIVVNWVVWSNNRMKDGFSINVDGIFKSIDSDIAVTALDKVLHKKVKQVLIGELNTESKFIYLLKNVEFKLSDKLQDIVSRSQKQITIRNTDELSHNIESKEIKLLGKKEGEYSKIEQILAEVLKKVLGFDEINIYDNFFDLGLDSILLSKVHLEIERHFPGKVNVADLFAYTSISSLSKYIDKSSKEKEVIQESNESYDIDEKALGDMLDKLQDGELSAKDILLSIDRK